MTVDDAFMLWLCSVLLICVVAWAFPVFHAYYQWKEKRRRKRG